MYQIFYIDIDEEITSVIDRLKKSKAAENFFVVSPRSLILQSVVSLKLLKREAAKEKKQIAIVVNDRDAGMKIEKAGILVLSSLKGLEGGEEIKENFSSKMEIKDLDNKNKYKNVMEKEKNSKKTRLQKIGSENFYDEEPETEEIIASAKPKAKSSKPKKSAYLDSPAEPAPKPEPPKPKNISDITRGKTAFSYAPEVGFNENISNSKPIMPEIPKEYNLNKIADANKMDPYKEKLVEGFFNPESKKTENSDNQINRLKNEPEKSAPVSHKMRKVIFSFAVICLLAVLFAAAYLFLPKAMVAVSIREETKKFDLEIKGMASISEVIIKELSIPSRIVEKEDSMTNSFKATGKKASSSDASQKAKGKATIYNEYSKDSQQLVATTRFLSTSGKLFRLVKGVTVPGMSGSNPGTVEVDVIADQSGNEYNIEPTSFKIPGFEGTSKYDKFYAKSLSVMAGGGGAGSSDGITVVSQSDLDSAKKESEEKIKDKLEEDVRGEIGSGGILLSDASEKSISESSSSVRANEVAGSFDYKIKGKIKAIVFSENDLKKIIGETYNESNKGKRISDYSVIKINYGASSADYSSGSISIKVNVEIPLKSSMNQDEFKKKLLGKNETEIKAILKEYPQIDKINIDFWPSFMSKKVPQYEKRVEIEVKNGSN
jgi:hypothetical protein